MKTKQFTQNQKESMLEFAQRIGWKLRKQDEELINDFCSKIRVEKQVLSFKQASKMRVLSKTWLQASLTLPNLEFTDNDRKPNMKRADNIMESYRDGKIPIEKLKLSDNCVNSELFPLITKSLRELVLECCNLMSFSLSSGVVNCKSLRKLSLYNVILDENMLQTLLNSCPLIVSFILEHCWGLEKIKSDSLQVLKILYCYEIGEIDAPNLVSLEYMGYQIPELKIARESIQLKHSNIVLNCCDTLNAAWFFKLRKFLSNSASWPQISFHFSGRKINMKDLRLDHRGSTPMVDVLNVNIQSLNKKCPTFVDALLWSCHLKRLNVQSTIRINKCFIDRLMYMKNSSQSTSHGSKPWYSQLKEIKAFDGKNQPLELKSGELAVGSLMEGEKGYFLFDW